MQGEEQALLPLDGVCRCSCRRSHKNGKARLLAQHPPAPLQHPKPAAHEASSPAASKLRTILLPQIRNHLSKLHAVKGVGGPQGADIATCVHR